MTVVVLVCAVLLTAAAALALVRAERGPSMLDRTLALDILTGTLVGAIALEAAWSRRTDTVPMLVVLPLVGFVGSVTVARFAAAEPEGEGRVLSREELARQELERSRRAGDGRAEGHVDGRADDDEHHGGLAHGEVS